MELRRHLSARRMRVWWHLPALLVIALAVLIGRPSDAGGQECGQPYGIPCVPPTVTVPTDGGTDGGTDGDGGATTTVDRGSTTIAGATTSGSGGTTSGGLPLTGSDITTLVAVGVGLISFGMFWHYRDQLRRAP